jgi:branched-chain amino acid transport system permease protein
VESFNVVVGLSVLCMTYVCGITHISGAVLAGLVAPLGVFHTLLNTTLGLGEYYTFIAACALVLTAVLNPVGIVGGATQALQRHARRRAVS